MANIIPPYEAPGNSIRFWARRIFEFDHESNTNLYKIKKDVESGNQTVALGLVVDAGEVVRQMQQYPQTIVKNKDGVQFANFTVEMIKEGKQDG